MKQPNRRIDARRSKYVPPLVVLVVVVAGWYALAYSLDNNFASGDGSALIIPPPHQLFVGLNEATVDRIAAATWISLSTAVVGFMLAIVAGMALGIAMSVSRSLESALWPWLIAIQVTPIIVLTPIIIRVAGASFGARLTVTVLIAFFPIASNTLFGMRSVSAALHDVFTLTQASRWQRLTRLQLPAASPAIFAGLRVSAGLAVIGAIVGDFFFTRGTPGLGRLITFFFQDTRSGPMFVTALIAALIGLGFFVVVSLLRRLLVSPWHRP
ncbi:MAG: ABC transporter permease [Ilumatobacteraceae bacterium]|jgi:NitT/TauT family transport system permease protein|nr:nitrate ABC transporter permease [Actinomycetes bacterium]